MLGGRASEEVAQEVSCAEHTSRVVLLNSWARSLAEAGLIFSYVGC